MCHRTCIKRIVAQLSWMERGRETQGESRDMGALMDEHGADLLLCLSARSPAPHPAEAGTELTAKQAKQQQVSSSLWGRTGKQDKVKPRSDKWAFNKAKTALVIGPTSQTGITEGRGQKARSEIRNRPGETADNNPEKQTTCQLLVVLLRYRCC